MSVVDLDKYRLPRPKLKKPAGEYCCQRCDSGSFKITEAGAIYCWNCGSQINNLVVVALDK